MKRNLKQTCTHIRRSIFVFFGKMSSHQDYRVKRPKNMTLSEEQAVRIWTKVVHQPESNLMYNPQSHEAYAEWNSPSGTVYLFLENSNLRVINTVVGYDIRLASKVEHWCSAVFTREVSKRRNKFKSLAESKVVHSLDSLENRLKIF
jgi:hypothetical protein